MVAANPLDRIPDAKTALARLRSIDIENTRIGAIVPSEVLQPALLRLEAPQHS